jgi:hypothetical protein
VELDFRRREVDSEEGSIDGDGEEMGVIILL